MPNEHTCIFELHAFHTLALTMLALPAHPAGLAVAKSGGRIAVCPVRALASLRASASPSSCCAPLRAPLAAPSRRACALAVDVIARAQQRVHAVLRRCVCITTTITAGAALRASGAEEAVRASALAALTAPAGCASACPCCVMAMSTILAGAVATTARAKRALGAFCKIGNYFTMLS